MAPHHLVLPHAKVKAGPGGYPTYTLEQALTEQFDTDAHIALYDADRRLLLDQAPEGATATLVALDYDLPDHSALSLTAEQGQEILDQAAALDPPPTHTYATRGGARLLYVLDPPVKHLETEAIHQQLADRLASQGFVVDPNCWSWCRLFRLPRVRRDGEDLCLPVQLNVGPPLNWQAQGFDLKKSPRNFTVTLRRDPIPEHQQALDLVWEQLPRSRKLTAWGVEARRRLRGRIMGELDKCFGKDNQPPIPDPRNVNLMVMIGSAVSIMQGIEGTTPDHIYGMLLDRVEQSRRPEDYAKRRDLAAECWKMIQYCWSHEEGLAEHLEEETAKATASALTEGEDLEDLRRRLVLRPAKARAHGYYVMLSDGSYSKLPQTRDTLLNALIRNGIAGPGKIIPEEVETQRGTRPWTPQEIINNFVTSIEPEIVKIPGISPKRGGWLDGETLHFGSYSRADLEPEWNRDVELWLQMLFGDHYEMVCRWIGLALAFERGPICALSVHSPPGTGKNLFVRGLIEATHPPSVVAAKHVFGRWQYKLEDTPWIWADEALPSAPNLANDFRTLISGGEVGTEQKYAHPTGVQVCPRILITANNKEAIETLFAAPGLTQSDVEAIAQRIYHVDCPASAAEHLKNLGSFEHTEGWVKGPQGTPSKMILARHFLALYEKHKETPAMGRFLMEGLTSNDLVAWLTTKNPDVARVADAIVKLLKRKVIDRDDPWVSIKDIKAQLDMDYVRSPYTAPQIGRHLRMLSLRKDDHRRRLLDMTKINFYENELGSTPVQAEAA